MIEFVVFVCLIRRWSQRYHLSKNMILLILWRLLLILSVFRCLCLFVSLSKVKKEILLSLLWNSRFQNHLMSFFFRIFLMSFFLRLFLMLCSRFLFVFSLRFRAIIAIRSLFVDLFFSKVFQKRLTFYFIFQLI